MHSYLPPILSSHTGYRFAWKQNKTNKTELILKQGLALWEVPELEKTSLKISVLYSIDIIRQRWCQRESDSGIYREAEIN